MANPEWELVGGQEWCDDQLELPFGEIPDLPVNIVLGDE